MFNELLIFLSNFLCSFIAYVSDIGRNHRAIGTIVFSGRYGSSRYIKKSSRLSIQCYDNKNGTHSFFGSGLDHHHSFVVEYSASMDKDTFLDMHHDSSECTLNVCLGKDFEVISVLVISFTANVTVCIHTHIWIEIVESF